MQTFTAIDLRDGMEGVESESEIGHLCRVQYDGLCRDVLYASRAVEDGHLAKDHTQAFLFNAIKSHSIHYTTECTYT